MNKTPSVFLRNPENMSEMTREVNPLCQWVIDGEGTPTRKYDGTCVMFDGDQWWARREVKKDKTPPPNWVPVETDDVTGKQMGWEPIEQSSYIKMFNEALALAETEIGEDKLYSNHPIGTYELCGPRINSDPERFGRHVLVKHSEAEKAVVADADGNERSFIGTHSYVVIRSNILAIHEALGWEGIVWHHPDGRMAKMKARDYKLESSKSGTDG